MGVFWIMVLRLVDPDVADKFIPLALVGSLFPDLEHFVFHFVTHRNSQYSREIKQFLRKRQVVNLAIFLEKNHKTESFLPLHHLFVVLMAIVATVIAFFNGKEGTVVFLGAVAIHYLFDMVDDVIFLRRLNPNWTRGLSRLRHII